MDWSLKNGRILEMEIQESRILPKKEDKEKEQHEADMNAMVLHNELQLYRSCAGQRGDGSEITVQDLNMDCRNNKCMTCAARSPDNGFNLKEYNIQESAILQIWNEMKQEHGFGRWSTEHKIGKLCEGLAKQPMEEIQYLAKMGGVRMTRNETKKFLDSTSSTVGYQVKMVVVHKPR
jgi:hypothetical protein